MTSCDIGLISFLIDPDYQGKGYGKTIIRCGIQFLKNINTRIKRLNAEVLIENTASIKVFENIGFQRVDFQKHILFNYEMTQCK
jgi:RimJ/RimL family protein N-acetyltransferase